MRIRSQWSLALAARKSIETLGEWIAAEESQWSLALAARKRALTEEVVAEAIQSQWSLALAARKSVAPRTTWISLCQSQWSLALAARKRGDFANNTAPLPKSQWSLALAARKSSQRAALPPALLPVAMEPGLGGQEKHPPRPDPPPRRPCRNGAWPWRPGKDSPGRSVE